MRWFRPRTGTGRRVGNGREREAFEVMFHVFTGLLPNRQQDALALVITRPVLVGFTEITEDDGAVDR